MATKDWKEKTLMEKASELSALTDELRRCSKALLGIADGLAEISSNEPEEKPLTLEDVRAVLAEKSRQGFTSDVRVLLKKHGAEKLSEIEPARYKELLADAEVIGNA